ncbi:GvpL/GvpF family gas vesicle protein [Streptomyces meridianus]|uniref:GvpL/GvpF family gas vesicle protein n=1 Tax=Streptomyces meridianus TaxID=2938945 RepID=A0ABT0XC58_9ACTN|nr:GvpL/GvpF family gas vesicle protein [Streptomyces meridianus]MCM2580108.1 GvpL/GvpF family gas vesicle protein [Streptomyces meridianus]
MDPLPYSGDGTLSYVYAVGRPGAALDSAVADLTGLYGDPVRTVVSGGLAAVVSAVPAQDFGEAGLKAQLEDLARLEVVARGHHAVVDALATRTTVLPLRLATVHLDDASTGRVLDASRTGFTELLDRLDGHVEWGVKVYADPEDAVSADPGPAVMPSGGSESPGRAYLQRRRAQRNTRQNAHRAAQEVSARVAEAAASVAADQVAHRPQQGELAAGPGENIANGAYLVHRSRTEGFRTAVEEAARGASGVRVEVTGPWAPYSFASVTGTSVEH